MGFIGMDVQTVNELNMLRKYVFANFMEKIMCKSCKLYLKA